MRGEAGQIFIGLRQPARISARTFLAVRALAGLSLGVILASYGLALAGAVRDLIAGAPADVSGFIVLVIGGWALQQTLERMAWREPAAAAMPEALPLMPEMPEIAPDRMQQFSYRGRLATRG